MAIKKRTEPGATRELIIAAALKLIAKNGYAGTSISMICQEAGLNASSLYWFFKNKEDLFLCAIKEAADEFLSSVRVPVLAATDDLESSREELIKTVARRLENNADFLRLLLILMLEDQNSPDEFRGKIAEIRAGSIAWWKSLLAPLFSPLGETTAALLANDFAPLCRATINGAFIAQQFGEPIDIEDVLRQLTLLMLALVEKIAREK